MSQPEFMRAAIRLAEEGMRSEGGPFGCVWCAAGKLWAAAAIASPQLMIPPPMPKWSDRDACAALKPFQLMTANSTPVGEPCPMCLSAIYWARIPQTFYGNTRDDAAAIVSMTILFISRYRLPPSNAH